MSVVSLPGDQVGSTKWLVESSCGDKLLGGSGSSGHMNKVQQERLVN